MQVEPGNPATPRRMVHAMSASRQTSNHRGPAKRTRATQHSTSALDRLSADERTTVLAALLSSHPGLLAEADAEARRLLDSATVEQTTSAVAAALTDIPLEALASRVGRIPGRGYVHETEAAWELVDETFGPFRADIRRRVELGLTESATTVTAGVLAGLHRAREPEDGSVLAYAGPDCVADLVDEIVDLAGGFGVLPSDEQLGGAVQRWLHGS